MHWTTQCHKYSNHNKGVHSPNSKTSVSTVWKRNTNFAIDFANSTATIVKVTTIRHSDWHQNVQVWQQTATPAVVEQPENSDDDNQPVNLFTSTVKKVLFSNRHVDQSVSLIPCQGIIVFNLQKPTLRTKALVFFNSGSQISFISDNLQNYIRLLPQRTAPITPSRIAGVKNKQSCSAV